MRVLEFMARSRRLPIALDIGSESIKMIQFQQVRGGLVLVSAAAVWHFPAGSSEDPAQRREQAIEAIRRMRREGGFKGRDVLLALPCGQGSIQSIRLPKMPAHKWRQAVQKEARERFGFKGADDPISCIDCIDAGEVRWGNETAREVILLAADKKVIEGHVALLSAVKLSPLAIEAAPLVVFRAFERLLPRKEDERIAQVVVDIGASGTRVVVGRGKRIVFLKSLDVGGWAMTAAVAKQFGLSQEEAAQLRLQTTRQESARLTGKSSTAAKATVSWNAQDAICGVLESLAEEIALCLRYCSVTFRGIRPSRVILCGGEAYNPLVSRFLERRLGVPVVVGRPLHGLDTSRVKWDGDSWGVFAEWAVCAGLAAKHLKVSAGSTGEGRECDRLSA